MTMRLWLLGLLTAMIAAVPAQAQPGAAPTFYVVRHFDTPAGDRDPDLLPDGRARAAQLDRALRRNPPVAIYVSDFRRTRQTVEPLARRLRLTPIVYDPADTPALIALVRAARGPVMIVGHSNTVPAIVEALGAPRPADLVHENFGDLWTINADGTSARTRIAPRAAARAAVPTYYIIRHFDVPLRVQNPDLLPEGHRRAEALSRLLRRNPPAAIYVSDFSRTRDTVGPTARRLRITPHIYDPADTPALLARIRAETRGPVLILGHSSKIPDIITTLGGDRPGIPEQSEFGDLWTIYSDGTSSHTRVGLR